MNAIQPVNTIDDLARTAKMLAMSGYFKGDGNVDQQIAQMATKILAGQEIGFGPFASVNNIHVIQGKPVIGANLMASAVKASPHYDYRIADLTNDKCVITFFQEGDKIGESSFTMEDAKAANLLGKDNWKKFPRNMLFARAMSNGVRFYTPDVFSGNAVYTPDELDADWHVVEQEPQQAEQHEEVDFREEPEPEQEPEPEPEPEPDEPTYITPQQLKTMHGLGSKLYGEEWDSKRAALVKAMTDGKSTSANDLTQGQAQKLIDGISKRVREAATAQAKAATQGK